jgi:hypothetical protein
MVQVSPPTGPAKDSCPLVSVEQKLSMGNGKSQHKAKPGYAINVE